MALTPMQMMITLMCVYGTSYTLGDDVVILPLKSYLCDNVEPVLDYDINIRTINDEGDKLLDVDITLDEKFNENWGFILKIDKWNNGAWDENFYDADGPICQIINQYVSRGWKRFRDAVKPAIPEECGAEAGTYKLTDFEVNRSDYDIPVSMLGRYRVTARVSDEKQTELLCQVIEVETDKSG